MYIIRIILLVFLCSSRMFWSVESEPFNIYAGDQKEKLVTVRYLQRTLEQKQPEFYKQFNSSDKTAFLPQYFHEYNQFEILLQNYQEQIRENKDCLLTKKGFIETKEAIWEYNPRKSDKAFKKNLKINFLKIKNDIESSCLISFGQWAQDPFEKEVAIYNEPFKNICKELFQIFACSMYIHSNKMDDIKKKQLPLYRKLVTYGFDRNASLSEIIDFLTNQATVSALKNNLNTVIKLFLDVSIINCKLISSQIDSFLPQKLLDTAVYKLNRNLQNTSPKQDADIIDLSSANIMGTAEQFKYLFCFYQSKIRFDCKKYVHLLEKDIDFFQSALYIFMSLPEHSDIINGVLKLHTSFDILKNYLAPNNPELLDNVNSLEDFVTNTQKETRTLTKQLKKIRNLYNSTKEHISCTKYGMNYQNLIQVHTQATLLEKFFNTTDVFIDDVKTSIEAAKKISKKSDYFKKKADTLLFYQYLEKTTENLDAFYTFVQPMIKAFDRILQSFNKNKSILCLDNEEQGENIYVFMQKALIVEILNQCCTKYKAQFSDQVLLNKAINKDNFQSILESFKKLQFAIIKTSDFPNDPLLIKIHYALQAVNDEINTFIKKLEKFSDFLSSRTELTADFKIAINKQFQADLQVFISELICIYKALPEVETQSVYNNDIIDDASLEKVFSELLNDKIDIQAHCTPSYNLTTQELEQYIRTRSYFSNSWRLYLYLKYKYKLSFLKEINLAPLSRVNHSYFRPIIILAEFIVLSHMLFKILHYFTKP